MQAIKLRVTSIFVDVTLVAALLTLLLSTAFADEEFCRDIPGSRVKFRYLPAGNEASLTLTVPAHYRDAKFHYAEVDIGDSQEDFLRFEIAMTRDATGKYTAAMELPKNHALLEFRAIYFGKKCARELSAKFKNSRRFD